MSLLDGLCHEALRQTVPAAAPDSPSEGLVGRLLLVDARDMRFETIRYRWSAKNPLNGEAPLRYDDLAGRG